jgi:hypothetical protein
LKHKKAYDNINKKVINGRGITMTLAELFDELNEKGGNITPELFNDFIRFFGEEFPVEVKFHSNGRETIKAKDLLDPNLQKDIRYVSMLEHHFKVLFLEEDIINFIMNNFEMKNGIVYIKDKE